MKIWKRSSKNGGMVLVEGIFLWICQTMEKYTNMLPRDEKQTLDEGIM
jgi:hypothetical protein